MNKRMVLAMVVVILMMVTAQASAESILLSAPLMPGESGLSCACTNLTKNIITINIRFQHAPFISRECFNRDLYSGAVEECSVPDLFNAPHVCRVYRPDGKSVSAKQLKCTLSVINALGNTTAVIPVDTKYKQ